MGQSVFLSDHLPYGQHGYRRAQVNLNKSINIFCNPNSIVVKYSLTVLGGGIHHVSEYDLLIGQKYIFFGIETLGIFTELS